MQCLRPPQPLQQTCTVKPHSLLSVRNHDLEKSHPERSSWRSLLWMIDEKSQDPGCKSHHSQGPGQCATLTRTVFDRRALLTLLVLVSQSRSVWPLDLSSFSSNCSGREWLRR